MNRTLRGFLRKEFRQALRDPRMRIILFVAPMIQMTIFGVAISNEVKNIRLAAQYSPYDYSTREVYERALATGWFVPVARVTGADPYEWVRSGEVDAVLVAPQKGLARSLARQEGELQLLVNAKNVVRAQAVENYIKGVLTELIPPPVEPPLRLDVRILYNPTLKTSDFMVPGVIGMLVTVVTVAMTSMSIARERETGTLETLIAAPVRTWEVMLGKTLPFVILGMIQMPLVLAAGVVLFQVPIRGPLIMVFFAGFFYVCTTVALGTLVSTLAKNQQQSMLGGFLFLFPSILFSGLMFPLENMPSAFRALAYINPLAHFIMLMRNILLKGGDFDFVLRHTLALAGLATVLILISASRFKSKLQ